MLITVIFNKRELILFRLLWLDILVVGFFRFVLKHLKNCTHLKNVELLVVVKTKKIYITIMLSFLLKIKIYKKCAAAVILALFSLLHTTKNYVGFFSIWQFSPFSFVRVNHTTIYLVQHSWFFSLSQRIFFRFFNLLNYLLFSKGKFFSCHFFIFQFFFISMTIQVFITF